MNTFRFDFTAKRLIISLLAVVLFAPAIVRAQAEPLPTQEDLQKMFDDAQYAPLLAKIAKVERLTGKQAEAYDKFNVSMLKANTLIAQKQQQPAMRAVGDARKAASTNTPPEKVTEAEALEVLLKYSPKCSYTPKPKAGAKAESASLDLATREGAYAALLIDLQADGAAKAKAAEKAKTLPAIKTALMQLAETAPVEKVLTKNDDDSQKAIDGLVGQANTLLGDAEKAAADRIAELSMLGDQTIISGILGVGSAPRKRGFLGSEPRDMKAQIATCEKVQSAAKEFAGLSKRHESEFNAIATAAATAIQQGMTSLRTHRALDR